MMRPALSLADSALGGSAAVLAVIVALSVPTTTCAADDADVTLGHMISTVAVNAVGSLTPDAVQGSELQSLDWVPASCSASPGDLHHVDYVSQPTPCGDIVVGLGGVGINALPETCSLVRRCSAVLAEDGKTVQSLEIGVDFTIGMSGNFAGVSVDGATIHGSISSQGSPFPVSAASEVTAVWTGSLTSTGGSNAVSFYDGNLFDGGDGDVLIGAAPVSQAPPGISDAVDTTIASTGDTLLRQDPWASTPSALPATSTRRVFPPVTMLPLSADPATVKTSCDLVLPASYVDGTVTTFTGGLLAESKYSCSGAGNCPNNVVESLSLELASQRCEAPTVVPESVLAVLSTSVFVGTKEGEDYIVPRGTRAVARAMFQCATGGFVGAFVELRDVIPAGVVWPMKPYVNKASSTARLGMTGGLSLVPTGRLLGPNIVPSDLFGIGRGGASIADVPLSMGSEGATRATQAVSQVAAALTSGFDVLDSVVATLLDPSLVSQYVSAAARPTLFGFFTWLEDRSRGVMRAIIASDGSEIRITFTKGVTGAVAPLGSALAAVANDKWFLLTSTMAERMCAFDYENYWWDCEDGILSSDSADSVTAQTDATFFVHHAATIRIENVQPGAADTVAASTVASNLRGRAQVSITQESCNDWRWDCAFDSVDYSIDVYDGTAQIRARLSDWVREWDPWDGAGQVFTLDFDDSVHGAYYIHTPERIPGAMDDVRSEMHQLTSVSAKVKSLPLDHSIVDPRTGLSIDTVLAAVQSGLMGFSGDTRVEDIVDACQAAVDQVTGPANSNHMSRGGVSAVDVAVFIAPWSTECEREGWFDECDWYTDGISIDIRTRASRELSVVSGGVGSNFVVGSHRIAVPTVGELQAKILLDRAGNFGFSILEISVDGKLDDFAVPIQRNMLSGVSAFGASADINLWKALGATSTTLEDAVHIVLDADMIAVRSDQGADIKQIHIDWADSVFPSDTTQSDAMQQGNNNNLLTVSVTGSATEASSGVAPQVVHSAAINGAVKSLPTVITHVIDVPIPPNALAFDEMSSVVDTVNSIVPQLGWWGWASASVAIVSTEMCEGLVPDGTTVPATLNVTLNGMELRQCDLTMAAGSLMNTVANVNALLGTPSCGLGDVLIAKLESYNQKKKCGFIGLHAAYTGAVWDAKFRTDTHHSQQQLVNFNGNQGSQDARPLFGTWIDAAELWHGVFEADLPFTAPKRVIVSTADSVNIVPSGLEAVFPTTFVGFQLPLHLHAAETINDGVGIMSNLVGGGPRGDSIRLNVSAGSSALQMELGLATELSIILDSPPRGPAHVLSTLVAGETSTSTAVEAGLNTMDLLLAVEQRHVGGDYEIHKWAMPLTLEVGQALEDAVRSAIEAAIQSGAPSSWPTPQDYLHDLVDVGTRECRIESPTCVPQLVINVTRTELSDGSWLLPISVATQNVHLAVRDSDGNAVFPMFANHTSARARYDILLSNMMLSLETKTDVGSLASEGSIGVIGAQSSDGGGHAAVSGLVKMHDDLYHTLRAVGSALRHDEKLTDVFEATVHADVAMLADDIELEVDEFDVPGTKHAPAKVSGQPTAAHFSSSRSITISKSGDRDKLGQLVDYALNFTGVPEAVHALNHLISTDARTLCNITTAIVNAAERTVDNALATTDIPFIMATFEALLDQASTRFLREASDTVCRAADNEDPVSLQSVCDWLKAKTGFDICDKTVLTSESVKLALNATLLDMKLSDAFRFDTSELFGHDDDLPVGMSAAGALAVHGSSQLVLTAEAALAPLEGVASVAISDLYADVQVSVDQHDDLAVWFGPVQAHFGGAHVYIAGRFRASLEHGARALELGDSRRVRRLPATDSAPSMSIAVDGSASLQAQANLGTCPDCHLNLTIPHLVKWLEDDRPSMSAVIHDLVLCGEDFINSLVTWLEQHSFWHALTNIGRLFQQLKDGISGWWHDEGGIGGLITEFALPLIDKEAQHLLEKSVGKWLGPAVEKEIISNINRFVSNVVHNGTAGGTYNFTEIVDVLDGKALEVFTDTLCHDLLHGRNCPPTPRVGDKVKKWPIKAGMREVYPLPGIRFDLGSHGDASLDCNCNENLVIEWELQFTLEYSQRHGIRVLWDFSPVFMASVGVDLKKNGCGLSGRLGALAVDMDAEGGVNATFTVTPPPPQNTPNKQSHRQSGQRRMSDTSKTFGLSLTVEAALEADVNAGFAGPLNKPGHEVSQTIPSFEFVMHLGWDYTVGHPVTTPTFAVTGVLFCAGTLLAKVLNTIRSDAGHVLDPLEKIFGKNGLLMTKVPASGFLMGHEMTLVDVLHDLALYYCDGECVFEGIYEAIKAFMFIEAQWEDFKAIDNLFKPTSSGNECADLAQLVHDFEVFWGSDDPKPVRSDSAHNRRLDSGGPTWSGPLYSNDLMHGSGCGGLTRQQCVDKAWESVTGQDVNPWSIKINFDDLPTLLVELILHERLTGSLVNITVPPARTSSFLHWEFPVWPYPEVILFVSSSVGLEFDVNKLVVPAEGLFNAVKNHDIGSLGNAIGLATRNADGSQLYQLSGFFQLMAQVDVIWWIFFGGAKVGVTFLGQVGLRDVYNVGYVTLTQLFWLFKNNGPLAAFIAKFTLTGYFGIEIGACICFTFFCVEWVVVDEGWSAVLWSETWEEHDITLLTDGMGDINLKQRESESASGGSVYHIGGNPVSGVFVSQRGGDDSDSVPSRQSPPTPPPAPIKAVTYSNNDPSQLREFHIGNTGLPVTLPPGSASAVNIRAADFSRGYEQSRESATMLLTNRGAFPSTGAPVVIDNGGDLCSSFNVVEMVSGAHTQITGSPCPTTVNSLRTSTINVTADPSNYGSENTVHVGPARMLTVSCPSLSVTATSESISGIGVDGSEVAVLKPAATSPIPEITVGCHPTEDCEFKIESNDHISHSTYQGGAGDDQYFLSMVNAISGVVRLLAGSGYNFGYFVHSVAPGADSFVGITSPTSVTLHHSDGTRNVILRDKIVQETHDVTFGPKPSKFTVVAPTQGKKVLVIGKAAAGVVAEHVVTGCETQAEVRVHLQQAGTHILTLGDAHSLASTNCMVRVYGDATPGQNTTLVVDGSQDPRSLVCTRRAGLVRCIDAHSLYKVVTIHHVNVQHFVMYHGTNGTDLHLDQGNDPVEYESQHIFSTANAGTENHVYIDGSVGNSVLLHGDIHSVELSPLQNISGLLVISGNRTDGNKTRVYMQQASSAELDGGKHIFANDVCLHDVRDNALVVPASKPGSWFCEALKQRGMAAGACERRCQVAYAGGMTHFVLEGTTKRDTFTAVGSRASWDASFGFGFDELVWGQSTFPIEADMGYDSDNVVVSAPVGRTVLHFSRDTVADTVTIYENGMANQWDTRVGQQQKYGPYGPGVSDGVYLKERIGALCGSGCVKDRNVQGVSADPVEGVAPAVANPPKPAATQQLTQDELRQAVSVYASLATVTTGTTPAKAARVQESETAPGVFEAAITSCLDQPFRHVTLHGAGKHTVSIAPEGGALSRLDCSIILNADPYKNVTSHASLDATGDKSIATIILDRNAIRYASPASSKRVFTALVQHVDLFVSKLGSAGSHVEVAQDTIGQDTIFDQARVHEEAAARGVQNTANVRAALSSIAIVNEPGIVRVGLVTKRGVQVAPLQDIYGAVMVGSTAASPTPIVLASATLPEPPIEQHMYVDTCVHKGASDSSPLPVMPFYYNPSKQFCEALVGYGFPADVCSRNCTVGYAGSVTLNVTTGGGRDGIFMCEPDIPATIDLSGNADRAYITSPRSDVLLRAGGGRDWVTIEGDTDARVTVDCGRDEDKDVVRLFSSTCCTRDDYSSPSDFTCPDTTRTVGPLSPTAPQSALTILNKWGNDAEACAQHYGTSMAQAGVADLPRMRKASGHDSADEMPIRIGQSPPNAKNEQGVCIRIPDGQ